MLSFLGYDSGVSPVLRLRNSQGQFWNFTTSQWVAEDGTETRLNYAESANGDGTSLYTVNFNVPSGGPHIQEAVYPSGEFISCDSTAIDASLSESITPPTVTEIRQEMDTNSTKLANLDVAVSSRSTFAGGAVASVLGSVGGNVAGSVGSVTDPVTVGSNQDKAGYSLSVAGILAIWNQALSAGGILVNTAGAKLRDLVLGTDNRVMISANAQDLAGLKVTAKAVEDKTGYALTSAYDAAKSAASQASVDSVPTNPLLTTDARLDHLDADISGIPTNPLLDSNYTAPDNAAIASIYSVLQSATYGLERLDAEIDAITSTLSTLAVNADMQTILDRLTGARALLLDNLQNISEGAGLTEAQVNALTEARDEARLARQMQTNKAVISNDGLSVTIYADDMVTPLWVFSIPDNKHRTPTP